MLKVLEKSLNFTQTCVYEPCKYELTINNKSSGAISLLFDRLNKTYLGNR